MFMPPKRTTHLHVLVTAEERRMLDELAATMRTTISEALRQLAWREHRRLVGPAKQKKGHKR
jgi:hypothetical protein